MTSHAAHQRLVAKAVIIFGGANSSLILGKHWESRNSRYGWAIRECRADAERQLGSVNRMHLLSFGLLRKGPAAIWYLCCFGSHGHSEPGNNHTRPLSCTLQRPCSVKTTTLWSAHQG